jgi:hypothetical protein
MMVTSEPPDYSNHTRGPSHNKQSKPVVEPEHFLHSSLVNLGQVFGLAHSEISGHSGIWGIISVISGTHNPGFWRFKSKPKIHQQEPILYSMCGVLTAERRLLSAERGLSCQREQRNASEQSVFVVIFV